MKPNQSKESHLPNKWAIHIKFLLFCAVFTPIWGLIIGVELTKSYLIATFLMMCIMMEILYPLSKKLFEFKGPYTQKDITVKYLSRLLLFFLLIMILSVILFVMFAVSFNLAGGFGFPDLLALFYQSAGVFKTVAIALFFTTPMFFYIPWQQAMKREFQLREQNLIFQNETLKSQINPHFLFNCLNTLSSLVNTQTDIANRFIAKLSAIYRYILDNSSKVKVPLQDELAFIADYFYLHQIRNEGKMTLSIDIPQEERGLEILPVSLQLLIENAIKHNMATLDKPLQILVYREGSNVVVKNNVQKMATQVVSTHIGLKNLNERVRLVTGNEIVVTEQEGSFWVKVPLIS